MSLGIILWRRRVVFLPRLHSIIWNGWSWNFPINQLKFLSFFGTGLKGTVPRDFLPLVFFFKQLLLAPVDKPSNNFNFFLNIRGDIRLFQCFAGVNNTSKWHFYCFRELHRCQQHRQKIPHLYHWHQRSMHSPVSMAPAKHVFASVGDTGEDVTGVVDTGDVMHHRCHWYRAVNIANCDGVNDTGNACRLMHQ